MTEKKRKPGRPHGTTKDRVKIGVSISRENAEWLREKKQRGHNISRIIDAILNRAKSDDELGIEGVAKKNKLKPPTAG